MKDLFKSVVDGVVTVSPTTPQPTVHIDGTFYAIPESPEIEPPASLFSVLKEAFPFLFTNNTMTIHNVKFSLTVACGISADILTDGNMKKFMAFFMLLRNKFGTPVFFFDRNPALALRLVGNATEMVAATNDDTDGVAVVKLETKLVVEDLPEPKTVVAIVEENDDPLSEGAPESETEQPVIAPLEDAELDVTPEPIVDGPASGKEDAAIEDAPDVVDDKQEDGEPKQPIVTSTKDVEPKPEKSAPKDKKKESATPKKPTPKKKPAKK